MKTSESENWLENSAESVRVCVYICVCCRCESASDASKHHYQHLNVIRSSKQHWQQQLVNDLSRSQKSSFINVRLYSVIHVAQIAWMLFNIFCSSDIGRSVDVLCKIRSLWIYRTATHIQAVEVEHLQIALCVHFLFFARSLSNVRIELNIWKLMPVYCSMLCKIQYTYKSICDSPTYHSHLFVCTTLKIDSQFNSIHLFEIIIQWNAIFKRAAFIFLFWLCGIFADH